MPNIVDLANSIAQSFGIPIWEAQEFIRKMSPVLVIGDLEDYQRVSRYPAVGVAERPAGAGNNSIIGVAGLAGVVARVTRITAYSPGAGELRLTLGAPMTGGAALGGFFRDRRITGTPSFDFRMGISVGIPGTVSRVAALEASVTQVLEVDYWLTEDQGMILGHSVVNTALTATIDLEVFAVT